MNFFEFLASRIRVESHENKEADEKKVRSHQLLFVLQLVGMETRPRNLSDQELIPFGALQNENCKVQKSN